MKMEKKIIQTKSLAFELGEFVDGLLKHANCNHTGNCLTMCHILKPYISALYEINTLIKNVKVKQGRKKVNHFVLLIVKDGRIIDATASQFKKPNGSLMPKIYIGERPDFYLNPQPHDHTRTNHCQDRGD